MTKKAVHFGAGNIGRGFVGALLHEGGYEITFSDVAAPPVDALKAAATYVVPVAGAGGLYVPVTAFPQSTTPATPATAAAARVARGVDRQAFSRSCRRRKDT